MNEPSAPLQGVVETRRVGRWSVCRFRLGADYRMSRHQHRHPGLVIGLRGSWHATTSRGEHRVDSFHAVVLPEAADHAERAGRAGAEVLLLCDVSGGEATRPAPREIRTIARPGIAGFASMFARALRSADPVSRLDAEEVLHGLLDLAGWGGARPESAPAWLHRVRERIHDALPARPTLAGLAGEAGVSPEHLVRTFRRAEGRSIGSYLRAARLDRAVRELRETDRPLAQIAIHCGFTDQSHLTRAFRTRFGQPPGAFRAEFLKCGNHR